ncbi:helix-turn-helix transcriptional regulator [Bradyrhizobium sp. SSUT77]|nr:helix-turn-helix transcriptional regulator [Bradyrhizobium sp. SSUT77]MDH2341476.1 helix-turn-helix transcriptional regulator [Bradyrhizobium sp. SSUT77]
MDVRKIVGMNVRKARLEAGISQEELAGRMGVEQFYISGLEAGRRNATLVTLWRAAIALNIDAGLLFDKGNHRAELPKSKRSKGR